LAGAADRDAAALTLAVPTGGGGAAVRELLDELDPDRAAVLDFEVRSATLDDVFMALTGDNAGIDSQRRTELIDV
jgi:ABC-2 type transport system ATP-binding protein